MATLLPARFADKRLARLRVGLASALFLRLTRTVEVERRLEAWHAAGRSFVRVLAFLGRRSMLV